MPLIYEELLKVGKVKTNNLLENGLKILPINRKRNAMDLNHMKDDQPCSHKRNGNGNYPEIPFPTYQIGNNPEVWQHIQLGREWGKDLSSTQLRGMQNSAIPLRGNLAKASTIASIFNVRLENRIAGNVLRQVYQKVRG